MNEKELIQYYNKFNEEKRLNTRHGRVEFLTAIHYIEKYLKKGDKILDVGAGTGKYSFYFQEKGYDVTALELVKHNLKEIEKKNIKAVLGNALDLSKFEDQSFDIVILFGPMYHLISFEEKKKALEEAKRVTKKNGYIFISYCMNEYAVITHAFRENFIKKVLKENKLDSSFHVLSKPNDLYSFVRIEEIDQLKEETFLKRISIIAQDGPTEYLKKEINQMDEETFQHFFQYHLETCERKELLGASRHILDILQKKGD